MTSITNLAIAGAGLTTIGGMVYGSYELLKDVQKPITDLLTIKKRVLLKKDGDEEDWKKSWAQYIEANTKTVEVESTEAASPLPNPAPTTPKKVTQKVISDKDIWSLNGWTTSVNADKVLDSFKEKCEEKSKEEEAGIWTKGYKEFEKYCTKQAPDED